jgi:hypothetical protein
MESMITTLIYPFNTWYLKSQMNRGEIEAALKADCFLSDEGYQSQSRSQSFYGKITEFDFQLETIRSKESLAPFAHGEVRGVDRDMYIVLRCGAFQHRRIWAIAVVFLLVLAAATFQAPSQMQGPLLGVTAVFLGLLIARGWAYRKRQQSTLAHFNKLWNSSSISRSEVPSVLFR